MKRSILTYFLAFTALSACQQHTESRDVPPSGRSTVLITAGADDYQTRSAFSWSDSAVKDLQIIVTDGDGTLVESIYSKTRSGIAFTGDVGRKYKFRAIANLGHEISGKTLSDFMLASATVDFNSIQSNGVPMANASGVDYILPGGSSTLEIPVSRLLARVDFSIDRSRLSHADPSGGFRVKSLRICNATTEFSPLSETGIRKSDGVDGSRFDYAGSSDLNILNQGGTVSLYAFENLQGELLSGNTDPWRKVPENIDGEENCSYIELTASYNAQGLNAEDLVYRMYLGGNATSNFDIRRNTIYRLTLFPSEEEMDGHRGSWKISSADWSDSRTLRFDPQAILVESAYSNHSEVVMSPEAFEVSFSHTEWLDELGCSCSYDRDSHKLTIACERAPEKPVTDYVRVTSWDGRLEDELMVTVAEAKNPVVDIYLKGESADGVYITEHSITFEAGKHRDIATLGLTYVFRDGTEHTVYSLEDSLYKRTDVSFRELSKTNCFYIEYNKRIKSADSNTQSESALFHLSYTDEEGTYEGDIRLSSIGRLFSEFIVPSTIYVNVGGRSRVQVSARYKDGYTFVPAYVAFQYINFRIEDDYKDIATSGWSASEMYAYGHKEGSCPGTIAFRTPKSSDVGFPPDREYVYDVNVIVLGKGSLDLIPDYKVIRIEESYELTAKYYPSNDENHFIYVNPYYESSNLDIATVSSDGRVIGKSTGTAFIKATFSDSDSQGKSYTLTSQATVKVIDHDEISYDLVTVPSSVSIKEGESIQVSAYYRKFVNGVPEEETDITQHSRWSSSDESVATAMIGLIRAREEGQCTVTVEYEGLTASVDVEVRGEEEETIISYELVIPEEVTMSPGETAELKAFLLKHRFSGGIEIGAPERTDVTENCIWQSSDGDVAEVGRDTGTVTAHSAGTATVTARYAGGGETGTLVSNNCIVTVAEQSIGVRIYWGSPGSNIKISF